MAWIESRGYRVMPGEHIWDEWRGWAGRPGDRAADFNRMLASPDVAAIMVSTGGTGCLPIVDRLDFPAAARHPKVVLGMSDLTIFLNALTARAGLVTFHGPDLAWGFGEESTVELESPAFFGLVESCAPPGPLPAWAGPLEVVRPGRGEGPLVGGLLSCLGYLRGTPYWPATAGAILFVEGFNLPPATVMRWFQSLRLGGVLAEINGLVLGTWSGCFDGDLAPLADIVKAACAGTAYPIVRVAGIGHHTANATLPLGCRAGLGPEGLTLLEGVVT